MNILDLLNSTYKLGNRRQPSFVFSSKPFGAVYAFNKSVAYKPNNSIIEITMYITTATEKEKTAHKVSIALRGVNSTEYDTETLVNIIKMSSKYNKLSTEEIIEKIYSEEDIINGKFIIQSENNKNKYLLIDKRIPLTTDIRVKCSCFTGDTEVLMADGSYRTLKSLEKESNFSVLSYNKFNNKFEKATAVRCELKSKNAELLEVTLSDGTIIKATPEHRFLRSNGEWIQAKELKEGTYLKSANSVVLEYLEEHNSVSPYYTYIYLDPRKKGCYKYNSIEFEYEPFYVGVGCGVTRDIDNKKCYDKMSEIYEDGLTPILIKQDVYVDEYVAAQLKEKLIKDIGVDTDGGSLINRKIVENEVKEEKSQCFVKAISSIEDKEDVYCLTVEGLGNFLLKTKDNNSGVVVENCSDYYYTFAYYNAEHKVHIGMKPPKYISYRDITKKDTDFRPKRNPNRYPGVCKHLLLLLALLMNGRILNASNQVVDNFKGNMKRLEIYSRRDITAMLDKVAKELKAQNEKIKEQRQANKDYEASKKADRMKKKAANKKRGKNK